MIDRTQQNWPDGVTINLVVHRGEMKPLGRNLAMKMLLDKSESQKPTAPAPQTLNKYRHELNNSGTACATDCPACLWVKEQGLGRTKQN